VLSPAEIASVEVESIQKEIKSLDQGQMPYNKVTDDDVDEMKELRGRCIVMATAVLHSMTGNL